MKDCPDALTWQAVLDGEENDPALLEHLAGCPACRASYREISAAAGLAGALATEATLPPAVARRILRQAKPFPAGLVAALLFCLLAASAALLQPGGLRWWFTVGVVRMSSLILDGLLGAILLLQSLDPAMILLAALLLAGLEILVLHKLKVTEG